jgi:diguanylate cyclase (GGDEF)-like protein
VYLSTPLGVKKSVSRSVPDPDPQENIRQFSTGGQDSFLDLLIETLESMDRSARGQFLQKFFKSLAQVDLTEALSLEFWEQTLQRRRELSESLGKTISLKTALVDVLASTSFLRTPVLMEYEELKKLQINAATDALTGLYNRRLFDEYFTKELNRAKRYGQHLALVIMDLHRFKEVNDRYGHLHGDQALQIAAATLRRTLRTSDYAFRIGGDEFALLLLQTEPEQASTLCRRLHNNYASAIASLKLEVPLGLDYGVSLYPEDGDSKETLITAADQRLYEFKNAMRNQPAVIPIEPPAGREQPAAVPARPQAKKPPTAETKSPFAVPPPAAAVTLPQAAKSSAERRRWERVSLVGTRAYAVLGEDAQNTARVIDLSYGGVALQIERPEQITGNFSAVLHVPILPPVRVTLRRTNSQTVEGLGLRIGCAFIS